jgi:hypothetical protein
MEEEYNISGPVGRLEGERLEVSRPFIALNAELLDNDVRSAKAA